jgi:hypothetical protein
MERPGNDDRDVFDVELTEPLDATDPRFVGSAPADPAPMPIRRLVRSQGPGAQPAHRLESVLRIGMPLVFLAGLGTVAAVFFAGLRPGSQTTTLGPEAVIRAAVADRPHRVCFNGNNPCAWITVVDDRLLAFNTNGPLPQEYGRAGIAWCPSSGYYGSNATGSRFDQQGRLVRGPAPRGLDRFALVTDAQGRLIVDWRQLNAGRRAFDTPETSPPDGPDCDTIPFDRDADLELDAG